MSTITISRSYGSGGRTIAVRVRELLGYRFFDRLFMSQIAAETGISQSVVDLSDDEYKVRTFLERLMSFNPAEMVVSPVTAHDVNLDVSRFDDEHSVDLAKNVIRTASERDNLIIVGRGAQVILKDRPDAFHVRITAPIEHRLKRIQDRDGLSMQEARKQIERRDRSSREYMARFFGVEWDDPCLYHLTINTGYYDLEQAAQLIVGSAQVMIGAKPV